MTTTAESFIWTCKIPWNINNGRDNKSPAFFLNFLFGLFSVGRADGWTDGWLCFPGNRFHTSPINIHLGRRAAAVRIRILCIEAAPRRNHVLLQHQLSIYLCPPNSEEIRVEANCFSTADLNHFIRWEKKNRIGREERRRRVSLGSSIAY